MSRREVETRLTVSGVDKLTPALRKMTGASSKMTEAWRKDMQKMAADNSIGKLIEGYRKLEGEVAKFDGVIDNSTQSVSRLNKELEETRVTLTQQKQAVKAAKASMEALQKEYVHAETRQEELRAAVKAGTATQEELDAAVRKTALAYNALGESEKSLTDLRKEQKKTERSTKSLAKQIESETDKVEAATKKRDRYNGELAQSREEMRKAGVAVDNLAQAEKDALNTRLSNEKKMGDYHAAARKHWEDEEKSIKRRQKMQEKWAKNRDTMISSSIMLYGGLRAGGAAYRRAKTEAEYNEEFTRFGIKAELPEKGSGQGESRILGVKDFRERVSDTAQNVRLHRSQIAEGAFVAAEAGMSPKDIHASIPIWGKFGKVSGAAISDLVNLTDSHVNLLRVQRSELEKALEIQYAIGQAGKFELDATAQYGPAISSNMAAFGFTGLDAVASLSAALQVSRAATGEDSTAANNMKNFFSALGQNETKKRFKGKGISIEGEWKKAIGAGADPILHMIEVIREQTGGDQFRIAELLGDQQARDFVVAMSGGIDAYKGFKETGLKSSGQANVDFQRILNDPNAKMDALEQSFERISGKVSGAFAESLVGVLEAIQPHLDSLEGWIERNPEAIKTIAGLGVGVGAAVTGVGALGVAIGGAGLTKLMVQGGWDVLTNNMFKTANSVERMDSGLGKMSRHKGALDGLMSGNTMRALLAIGGIIDLVAGMPGQIKMRPEGMSDEDWAAELAKSPPAQNDKETAFRTWSEKNVPGVAWAQSLGNKSFFPNRGGHGSKDRVRLASLQNELTDIDTQLSEIKPGRYAALAREPLEMQRDRLLDEIKDLEMQIAQSQVPEVLQQKADELRAIKIPSVVGSASAARLDGTRARGGRVRRGLSYLVGEYGEERFEPDQNGTIVPAHQVAAQRTSKTRSRGALGDLTINIYDARDPMAVARAVEQVITRKWSAAKASSFQNA